MRLGLPSWAPRALRWTAGAAVAGALAFGAWVAMPVPRARLAPPSSGSVTLVDRDGAVLRELRGADGARVRWVPLARIDPDLVRAVVAAEDRRFYEHGALDPRAAARAARDNLRAGRVVSGASTLAMQAARLVAGTPRGWRGKVAQVAWALRMGAHLSREEILEQYLNRVPMGQGAVGVEAGAALYLGASATDVSVGQAALLAGLLRAPSRDNPLVSPGRATAARARVLARLRAAGWATPDDSVRAAAEPVLAGDGPTRFLAPHFTTRALAWLADEAHADARDDATVGGELRTSLDLALQQAIEREVRHAVEQMASRGGRQGAAVVLDNATGEILAWVGSPDFWAEKTGQADMVVSARQPGSALKPFLFALAFDRGATPATVLADVARSYRTSLGGYRPRNYDRRFHGPVRAREALGNSYNVPAVALAEQVGVPALLATLRDAGFASLGRDAAHYGLGLALGNGEVTLLELANAYRMLANGGEWRPVTWRAGGAARAPARRVVSRTSAALVLDVLDDPAARVAAFGTSTPLEFPFPAAAKTGTSRHFTDNWAVATTGGFTVAVWMGDVTGRPMAGVSGVSGAGPLLHRAVMLTALRHAPGVLPTPAEAGAQPAEICRLSGARPGARCPRGVEWFAPGHAPRDSCTWHGEEGMRLPDEYAEWAATSAPAPVAAAVPDESPPRPAARAPLRIVSPRDGDRYALVPGVDARYATVALRAAGAARDVRWYVDGAPVASARWPLAPGAHVVEVRAGEARDRVRIVVE